MELSCGDGLQQPCTLEIMACPENFEIQIIRAQINIAQEDGGMILARYNCNTSKCIPSTSLPERSGETTTVTTTKTMYTTIEKESKITCPTTTRSPASPAQYAPATTNLLYTTTSCSPTIKSTTDNSTLSGAIHGGYIVAILALVVIIITLVILMGYLFKRTTPQRGPVQTTHQSLTDMTPAASTAGDYCTPVALKQLQTSIETGQ